MGSAYPDDWDTRRKRVYRRDNYTCQKCTVKGGPYGEVELHAHHQRPISKGGSHELSNLETLCRNCHENEHPFNFPFSNNDQINNYPEKGSTAVNQQGIDKEDIIRPIQPQPFIQETNEVSMEFWTRSVGYSTAVAALIAWPLVTIGSSYLIWVLAFISFFPYYYKTTKKMSDVRNTKLRQIEDNSRELNEMVTAYNAKATNTPTQVRHDDFSEISSMISESLGHVRDSHYVENEVQDEYIEWLEDSKITIREINRYLKDESQYDST